MIGSACVRNVANSVPSSRSVISISGAHASEQRSVALVREPETQVPLVDPRGRSRELLRAIDAHMASLAAAVRTLDAGELTETHATLLEELDRERARATPSADKT